MSTTAFAGNVVEFKRPAADRTAWAEPTDSPHRDETPYGSVKATQAQPQNLPALAPRTIQILSLQSNRITLSMPLPVSLEWVNDQVVARSYDLDLFECGDTEGEALDALREMIVEFYFSLKESGADGRSSYLSRKFEFLESITQCR